jgi:hypothetical protein
MARTTLRVAAGTFILSTWTLGAALAGDQTSDGAVPASTPVVQAAADGSAAPGCVRLTSMTEPQPQPQPQVQPAANPGSGPVTQTRYEYPPQYEPNYHLSGVVTQHPRPVPAPYWLSPDAAQITPTGYPYLNAPMYPVPKQDVPYQTGATVLTNQAFYPHEMLYPHTYRALYPPYYYEVHGCWKTLPWGISNVEHWRLRGTLVTVKYRSSISIFSGFASPVFPFSDRDANPMGTAKNDQDPAYIH